jgi:hypothetical protein
VASVDPRDNIEHHENASADACQLLPTPLMGNPSPWMLIGMVRASDFGRLFTFLTLALLPSSSKQRR